MINKEVFLKAVKKVFPNATSESIILNKSLMKLDFCWCYGEVSINNMPNKYKNDIININEMARLI